MHWKYETKINDKLNFLLESFLLFYTFIWKSSYLSIYTYQKFCSNILQDNFVKWHQSFDSLFTNVKAFLNNKTLSINFTNQSKDNISFRKCGCFLSSKINRLPFVTLNEIRWDNVIRDERGDWRSLVAQFVKILEDPEATSNSPNKTNKTSLRI